MKLFSPIADTEMKFPKFHIWYYHMINTIREYGAINGSTTETYESLHKFCIKIPYRMSNRQNATSQIINTVRHDSILNYLKRITSSTSAKKHRQTLTLSGIKESFLLSDFNEFINEYKVTYHLAQEDEKAFDVLIEALNQYFDLIEGINDDDVKAILIKWYTNASIGIDTVCANTKYYNAPTFSNVAINMNEEEAENYHT
ncbi:hypothetical protein RhiirA5_444893, partial [Rhizophagus irregularis]